MSLRRETYLRHISLQQTGFTSWSCHHDQLWALTPLFSSLPLTTSWRFRNLIAYCFTQKW